MPRKKTSLSKNEWAIMDVLWKSQRPMVLSEIINELKDKVNWSYPTYQTQLRRLAQSGYLEFEMRGHNKFFWPAVMSDDCIKEEAENINNRLSPQISNKLLLCMLRDAKGLTKEESDELNRLANELKDKSDGN